MFAKTSASLRFNPIKVTRTEQCSLVYKSESMRDICYTKERRCGLSWFVFHAELETCSASVDGQVGDFASSAGSARPAYIRPAEVS